MLLPRFLDMPERGALRPFLATAVYYKLIETPAYHRVHIFCGNENQLKNLFSLIWKNLGSYNIYRCLLYLVMINEHAS